MRALGMVALLGLVACAAPGTADEDGPQATRSGGKDSSLVQREGARHGAGGPFAGAWASCEGASSSDECSRYLLVQRGERICGAWSYLASGQAYAGNVVARAISSSEARRTHVCGRPGSETDTECEDGWQRIDKPLRLCAGKLGDLAGTGDACFADYRPVPVSEAERDAFEAQLWVRNCLSNEP